jgi:protease-4
MILSSIISSITYDISPKIAVVPIVGPITSDKQTSLYGTTISSREIASTLRTIQKDTSIKGVILDINSPGGSPVATEEIAKAVEALSFDIPVYAIINDVGASGAFWIAVSADKVYASSMSTLGSIGVTSAGLSFEDFIRNYNITYRKQTAGEYKDMGTPFREPTEKEEEIIQEMLDEIHVKFVEHVAKSRNLNVDDVWPYATGEVFLGSKALNAGFIDEIGYFPDVLIAMESATNLTDPLIVTYGREPTLLEVIGVDSLFNFNPSSESAIMLR